MNRISLKKQFPWGDETFFKEKIMKGIHNGHIGVVALNNEMYSDEKILFQRMKLHTFRESDHWLKYVGKEIVLFEWSGKPYRSPQNEIATVILQSIQKIEIKSYYKLVFVDGKNIRNEELLDLQRNDGFESSYDFFKWFNKDFKGYILHWTYLKY